VYHPDAWREFDAKYIEPLNVFENPDHSWRTREIYRNQDEVEPDRQGRVLIPRNASRELGLSGKVKIIGTARTWRYGTRRRWPNWSGSEVAMP
jgi:DNA-binding transcriptional regulator/RsmH inhibitor MraZ